MWGRGVPPAALPAPLSATLSLALSVHPCECGAAGSASGQTACPFGSTLRQSGSRHSNASPLRPGRCLDECSLFTSLVSDLPSAGQLWLREEVQRVHLRRHLGSLKAFL